MTIAASPRDDRPDSPSAFAQGMATTRSGWVTVGLATAFVAALATWNSAHKSMWLDESYSMYTATLPVATAIRHSLGYELQPPLYFVLLDFWLRLSRNVMFGRVVSTVAVMVFVVTIAAAARRLGVRQWPRVAAVVAVVPGVLWAASELRGYGLVMCLAALNWYCFLGIVEPARQPRWRDALAYVLTGVALVYSFYYGAFVIAGQWAGAVATRRRWPLMTGMSAAIALSLAPLVPSILWEAQQHPLLGPRIDVFSDPMNAIGQTIVTFVQSVAGSTPVAGRAPFLALIGIVILAAFAARPLASRRSWSADDAMVAIASLTPVVCIGVLRLFDLAPVQGRHFVVGLAGLVLLAALWADAIRPAAVRAGLLAALTVVIAMDLYSFERNAVQLQDWAGVARYVSARVTPRDKVLIYIPDEILAFRYYYTGPARVYGLPSGLELTAYHAASEYAIRDTAQIAGRLAAIGAADSLRPPVWFILTHEGRGNADPAATLTGQYLQAHYDVVDRVDSYDGIRILHARSH
jgi:mannosyltransferase